MYSPRFGSIRSRCSSILIVLAFCLPLVLKSQLANADDPSKAPVVEDEVDTLIEQLSSSAFATREAASKRLLEIGAPTLEKLGKAKQHSAIEVRERAARISQEIDKGIFENITKKFILTPDGTQSFGLPAWSVFRSITGDSRTSKLLFVTMLRSQSELARYIEAASNATGTANSAVAYEQLAAHTAAEAGRLRVRSLRGQLPTVGDTVGLMLACSLFSETGAFSETTAAIPSASNEVNEVIVASLYPAPQAEYFLKPGYDRCMRSLAGRWITKTQASIADEVLSLAYQRNIAEGAVVARRHLDASNDRQTRVYALQCLARFGNEGDIPAVAKLLIEEAVIYEFADQSNIGNPRDGIQEDDMAPPDLNRKFLNRKFVPVEVRKMIVRLNDLALAVCMKLGSEDLTEAFPKYQPNETSSIVMVDFAFPEDAQELHKLAIARWKQRHPELVKQLRAERSSADRDQADRDEKE